MSPITSFRVDYKHVDGWHVFTSESLPGLYVASEDPERAYNDVARSVEMLVELDTGIPCKVAAEVPFAEFVQAHRPRPRAAASRETAGRKPAALSTRRYALIECAEPA